MKAVRNPEGPVALVDVPEPEPTEGTVVVDVRSVGICGSDVHLVAMGPLPVTLGHEFAGTTADGARVTVRPYAACGRCPACAEGRRQQCPRLLGAMYGVSLDGGMAERIAVEAQCVIPLPDDLPMEHAGLVEPIAVAVHGVHRGGVAPGSRVLVIGAGPIGLCAVAAARHEGAEVDVAESLAARGERAEALGARVGEGRDYDVVVDCAGTQGSADLAVRAVRSGGVVSLVGTHWAPVALPMSLQMKEVTLVPSFTYGEHGGVDEFETAMAVLGSTPQLAGTLITHRLGLDDAVKGFALAADATSGAIKVTLHP